MKALILLAAVLASDGWTLSQCIDYALEHNLTVKTGEVAVERAEIDVSTAKGALLPYVNASVGENISFGRALTADNTYAYKNNASTSVQLGAGMTLFDGLKSPRRIKLTKLNLEAATADLDKIRDDIRVAVARAYVEVVYAREVLDVAARQIEIDSLQVVRMEGFSGTGMASKAELAQQKASLAESQVTLVEAENNLRAAILDLKQLLELSAEEPFDIVIPSVSVEDIVIGNPEDIYQDALSGRPAVRAESVRLESSEQSLKIARADLYPSLSLNGGIGSNYYSLSDGSLWNQFSNNFSQYIGLQLNIPIFSQLSVRNNIRSAKLGVESQRLQLETVKKSLYKEIVQAWNGAVSARSRYEASLAASDSYSEAFELMTARYENGKATATEFSEAKTRHLKALSDALRAGCELIYTTKLLDFYRGGSLEM